PGCGWNHSDCPTVGYVRYRTEKTRPQAVRYRQGAGSLPFDDTPTPQIRNWRMENALRTHRAVDVGLVGDFSHRSGQRRHRASRREHRDQPAGVPRARPGAGLPGLLRSATGLELFLLRRDVLGFPGGQLVREFLV